MKRKRKTKAKPKCRVRKERLPGESMSKWRERVEYEILKKNLVVVGTLNPKGLEILAELLVE
ncbi:MAG TPA: hypothetical protein VGP72_22870 [Planctomycetota bacterium]|jgi:hypothetical protein